MESEGDNLEQTGLGGNPDDPDQEPVRVKRRRRRTTSEASAPAPLQLVRPSKKRREKSIWKSPVLWAAMNFVTAAVTFVLVKWPDLKLSTQIAEIKPPPIPRHAEPGGPQANASGQAPGNEPALPNEPVEEVPPRTSPPAGASAGKPTPAGFASFFGKKGPVTVDEGMAPPARSSDGFAVPKDFQPETLPMQPTNVDELEVNDSADEQKNTALAQAELVKAAKFRDASDLDHAIECYLEAVRLDPQSPAAAYGLGQALQTKGRIDEAVVYYFKAIRMKPDYVAPLTSLAWLSATHPNPAYRNGTKAVELAERSCKITRYEEAAGLDTLAAAYAEAGRYTEAADTAQKAMDLAKKAQQQALLNQIQKRIEYYKAGKPYHSL